MARDRLPSLEKMPLVEPQTEWMIFQALAGAWPSGEAPPSRDVCTALLERLQQFLQKAAREAKLASNWNAINADYEAALGDYASSLLDPLNDAFRRDFHETLKPFIRAGEMNALTQAILKLTAPGIPDIYQGSEQQDFSFVDPDNRRLPDFDRLSGDLPEESLDEALDLDPRELQTGRLKQKVIARLLHLRRHFPSLFLKGDYRPLAVEGENRSHLLAFLRRHEGRSLIVAVPLKTLCLERGERCNPGEGRTRVVLPEDMLAHGFTDLFTGRDLNFPDRDENVSGFAAAGYSLMFGAGN
ncbi:hypothetical protein [Gellertiella hungarica]|uniref:Maltooligosyltrehalose synthase n=1 Tax=Gellertiella hungarica TaxID=1572859 RepID=A0A7W6J5W0_9HYPH|nr:hypothetical protein [Gellertiella hungarica]MBB4065356.1 maltooligosyltrehalose synthase [Gellertiella hungarica]